MMDNQQQDPSKEPLFRVEQKARSATDIWVLCKSKTYPGLLYYFNKATGEAMWSTDFEKLKKERTVCDMFKRTIHFSHNYPEPQVPPSKSQYVTQSPSSSNVYNKQIINNKFSRNAYPWSTFGNVSFPNYLTHPVSQQYAYNFPGVQFTQNAWAIPPNTPIFVSPSVAIPNDNQSFNFYHDDQISVQNTSISLSDRFKNMDNSIVQASRKIQIPRVDKSNPRFGKNFRHRFENSTGNITEDSSNNLHYNDLRLMLEAKRKKSVDGSEMKNVNEESYHDSNYKDESEGNQENITMKMIDLQVSSPNLPEDSSSSLPTRKKITFDSLNVRNTEKNMLEEEINPEKMCKDDMDLHGTLQQIDVTLLKRLAKPDDRNDVWFVVVDTCVLLSNLVFVNMLVKSDNKCRMMIPYRVHDELESQCSDMFRNHTLRTVAMAQRARRYISKELSARTCLVAQTAVEAEDRNINCPTEDDDILNCCLQLTSQNYHVILLTNDENLIIKSCICGIQSFTVKSIKKYLSGKEPERTFLPAPLKITIQNERKEDISFNNSNFLVNNANLNIEPNIYETDISKNSSTGQNNYNFVSISLPQKRDIQQHVSSKCILVDNDISSGSTFAFDKIQDVECQKSGIPNRTILKKSDLFSNRKDLNLNSVHKNDHIDCDRAINYNSTCIRNCHPQHQLYDKTNSKKNNLQCKINMPVQYIDKELNTERFAHTKNCVTTKINENTGSFVAVNAADVQKNKKREIHLKRNNSNTLNDATTLCTKERPFKWRRRNNSFMNKNNLNKNNNINANIKGSVPNLIVTEMSQNKFPSQDIHITKKPEANAQARYILNGGSVNDNSFRQSDDAANQVFNNLKESSASVSSHIHQDVINYASESTNATDMVETVFNSTQNSNVTKNNNIREAAINEKVKYRVNHKNNDVIREQFLFNTSDKTIEEKFKMGCDEWLSRYVQIMEEVLTQILQQNPSMNENELLPPPWTLHEAAECIKVKYKSNTSITTPADQLSLLLFTISDKTGKIASNLNPEQYMKLFDSGLKLVEALREIDTDSEDITIAKTSLYKLLNDIQDPNSLGFDTEVTTALEDMLDENASNHSAEKDVNQIDVTKFSSIKLNNVPDSEEKQRSLITIRSSDQETRKNPNDVQSRSKKLINNKDTNSIIFDNNPIHLQNITISNTTKNDVIDKDHSKLSDLKRTIRVYDKNNVISSAPPEHTALIEKTQVESSTIQQKIIRNFTGISDFEKRLNEKQKSTVDLDNLEYAEFIDMDYELEEEDEYLDDEYESEFLDEFITEERDSLHDISKNLNSQKELNNESDNQRKHTHQVDATVFKKPMDVNKENEKVNEYKNIEIVIKTFLREIKETFIQIYTYCQEILKEVKQSSTLTSLRKQEIYKQTESTHSHLNNITKYLKTILRRDIDDGDKCVQSLIQRVILDNLSLNAEQNLAYREIITKCLDQASILLEVLANIISMSKQ